MKTFRLTCRRLGQVLLVSALMFSTLVTSAVGEALVLHQHGARRAHLHVVGYGDLLSNAELPSRLGHGSRPGPAFHAASEQVRVLAVVATGSLFVSTPGSTDIEGTGLESLHPCPTFSIKDPDEVAILDCSTARFPALAGRTASAVILLRNHTLLL